jgi:hypothetical protein
MGEPLGVDADLAVAAQGDGADVAGRDPLASTTSTTPVQSWSSERAGHAIDLGGVEQALHVFGQAEDGCALRLRVAADSLKDGRAVVDDVAHDVDLGLFPGISVPLCQILAVV